MAFALYYEAKRKEPLTEQEKAISKEISEKYCSEYPFKRKVEDFGIYDDFEYKDENILSTSGFCLDYFFMCLFSTELRRYDFWNW